MSHISTHAAAAITGLTQVRIAQLAHQGKLDGYKQNDHWFVNEYQVEILRQEQTYWSRKQVCDILGVTNREFDRLVQKGVIEARNTISEHQLFDPNEVMLCRQLVLISYSKAEVAEILNCSIRTVHRLIASGMIEEVETAHGLRVPFENLAMYFIS